MTVAEMTEKMIAFSEGNLHDIEHFLKVHSYARLIGRLEGLDEATQTTLELAAIVHDIACPLCRIKYGSASGANQEKESEGVLRPFLAGCGLTQAVEERIIYLVSHHHTYTNVSGADYQILLEADFLVNASESAMTRAQIEHFYRTVVKTAAGKRLFENIYLKD